MVTKYSVLHENDVVTEEMLRELDEAAKRPPVYDPENPPLTDEQLAKMRRVHEIKQEERRKQNVTLRLTPQTVRKAKALGKGYTSILSRIVEGVMNDPELLERYL